MPGRGRDVRSLRAALGRVCTSAVRDGGFWATLIGGLVGGCVGLVVGASVGWATAPQSEGFEGLEVVFAVAAFFAWLGAVGGAWLALGAMNDPARAGTIGWLALLAPPLVEEACGSRCRSRMPMISAPTSSPTSSS